jgi:GT2 family glycosyltransferase/glycosyltransferase involved in cell wall biosynthesis
MGEGLRVSIVVLTWNGLEVTRNCLDTLTGRTAHPDFEVVVVDNGSTDGTLEYLRGRGDIRLIENGENLGFVGGNNVGIGETAGDVVLLNNDTEIVRGDWLSRMQDLARSRDDIGLVGCRLVNARGELVHAGTYMPIPSFWGQEYPGREKDIGQYSTDREVEGVIAACVYIKREVIDEIGPLDEDYFSYYEDTDYCLKARKAGYRTFCCGGATVLHLENASTDLNRMDFSGTFRKSRETFISKWEGYYRSLFSRRLTWRSFLTTDDLYSEASPGLLWALERAGVEINLAFLEGAERAELADFRINDMKNREPDRGRPQVVFGPPERLDEADGTYNIGYVFTPYDAFPPEWVRPINRMDEVWVPSEFQKEAARDSGVTREVHVVPLGIDPDYMNPGIKAFPLSDRFCFLAPVGWGEDWASETLLRAFTEEFDRSENAVLVMVVESNGTGAEVEEAVEAMNLGMDSAPVVFMMDHYLPPYQRGSLFRSADCLVFPSRTSQAGRDLACSLACGKPAIVTGWGSHREMVDGESVLGVGAEPVPSPYRGVSLAQPDKSELQRMLRHAREDADALARAAVEVSRDVRRGLSWDRVASMIVERLDGIESGR